MDKIEVKVNVINQLKLLRQSTFKDRLCFIDEDIQNAQRAKATEVRITVDKIEERVTIENNGQILINPQALFSIAESEWDEDVKEQENPFGMGFFSNITVSDLIKIHSGNQLITFDVANMIQTNDTEIKVEVIDEYYKGFKLDLYHFDFKSVGFRDISDRTQMLGKYIHELDVYFNNTLQEKQDLTTGDDSQFQFPINDDKDFQGWLALKDNYSYGSSTSIFYKGRFVAKLMDLPYLKGEIHISDRALNLTSPDRKDIIQDSKLSDFKQLLKIYVEEYCENLVLDDTNDISDYTSCIKYYIDMDKIKSRVKFMTFKSNNETDYKYLKGIAIAKTKGERIESFNDYELYLKKDKSVQSEEHIEDLDIQPTILNMPPQAQGVISYDSSFSAGHTVRPEIHQNELIEEHGLLLNQNEEPIFYTKLTEIEQVEYQLNVAKHFKLKIIVARNDVEFAILRMMELTHSNNIFHLSQLKEDIFINGNISNTTLSNSERRALMIFNLISEILGFDHNIFSIGDLLVTKNVKIESIDVDEQLIESSIVVLKDSLSQKIYVDRSIINKNKLREDDKEDLDINDYKFIMANLKAISQQISELEFMAREECEIKILNILGNSN